MRIADSAIPEVKLIEPALFVDERGFFMETWNRRVFAAAGLDRDFVQDNHSHSTRGVLRGLHYQIRRPQGKLVRVAQGTVFDVAVDLRRSSPSFGRWAGYELSAANRRMLWVPPGFAHGFLTLSETADLLYKCTDFYAADWDRSLAWDDPDIRIDWPLGGIRPRLSAKDGAAKRLCEAELFA